MELILNDPQQMMADSVRDYLQHEYDFVQRNASLQAWAHGSTVHWSAFAEMGWLGLCIPEEQGGVGLGGFEAALLMREFGRALVVEPYLQHALVAAVLLSRLATPALAAAWLPRLVAGEARVAMAHEETGLDLFASRTLRARQQESGWRLDGCKLNVQGAAGADAFLVTASLQEGPALFLVPAHSAGLSLRPGRMLDGSAVADLSCDGLLLEPGAQVAHGPEVGAVLEEVLSWSLILQGWEVLGVMQAALEQTSAYARERQQFGQPIAAFQVVQHRLAEMVVCCEDARAACELAALKSCRDPSQLRPMAALVLGKVAREARYVTQQAIQLHGAMGVSEELPIPSQFRKALSFSLLQGGMGEQAESYARQMLERGAWRCSQTLDDLPQVEEA